jgi:hypothetical protein
MHICGYADIRIHKIYIAIQTEEKHFQWHSDDLADYSNSDLSERIYLYLLFISCHSEPHTIIGAGRRNPK